MELDSGGNEMVKTGTWKTAAVIKLFKSPVVVVKRSSRLLRRI